MVNREVNQIEFSDIRTVGSTFDVSEGLFGVPFLSSTSEAKKYDNPTEVEITHLGVFADTPSTSKIAVTYINRNDVQAGLYEDPPTIDWRSRIKYILSEHETAVFRPPADHTIILVSESGSVDISYSIGFGVQVIL